MDTSTQDNFPLSSSGSSQPSPSNFLTVPTTRTSGRLYLLPGPNTLEHDDSEFCITNSKELVDSPSIPQILEPSRPTTPPTSRKVSSPTLQSSSLPNHTYMSVYSISSADSEHSTYSNPPAKTYRLPTFQTMSSSRKISGAEKSQMIEALRAHHVNTLVELRRIERAFAVLGSSDVTEPMTAAWSYYVNSHSLLTELRGLTKNYPFSAECLEEAKRRVYSDPQSNRSWNFCWLVLTKIQRDQLIPYYAHYQATQPAMWGGRTPSSDKVTQLTEAFVKEWDWAIGQLLRHWDQPPSR